MRFMLSPNVKHGSTQQPGVCGAALLCVPARHPRHDADEACPRLGAIEPEFDE
jgi:hypothetical protein